MILTGECWHGGAYGVEFYDICTYAWALHMEEGVPCRAGKGCRSNTVVYRRLRLLHVPDEITYSPRVPWSGAREGVEEQPNGSSEPNLLYGFAFCWGFTHDIGMVSLIKPAWDRELAVGQKLELYVGFDE